MSTVDLLFADDSDDEKVFSKSPTSVTSPTSSLRQKTGACVHCKSLKVRCELSPGQSSCQRCQTYGISCQPRGRKKRKPAPTHEDLQERAHDQDYQIKSLLLQYDKMKEDQQRQMWFARAGKECDSPTESSISKKTHSAWSRSPTPPEYTSLSHYFPDTSQFYAMAPELVKYCSLTPQDISELFIIYFGRVNPFFSILDPELHKPTKLIHTSPFLFTVICAIASRHYTTKPGLYPIAQEFARDAAGKALIGGQKSVDICQAYLLLGVYPVPKKKWAEDRSWLFQGVAIRMAIELELDQPPQQPCDPQESLNRMRTWLNCYCVDGSHAIQFGKLPMLRLDDYMARTSQNWYRLPMTIPYDVHLVAYVQMIYIMSKWRAIVYEGEGLSSKIQNGFNIVAEAINTENLLSHEMHLWVGRYAEEYSRNPLPICAYRGNTTQMITAYLRLVVLAVGFQYEFNKSGITSQSEVLTRSIDAAGTVINIMVERLYPTGDLRYSMEAHFLYVAYAAAYLVNLLRPKFAPLLSDRIQSDIIATVTHLITILSSKEVAVDGRHTPALYSRFLSSMLAKYSTGARSRSLPLPEPTDMYGVEGPRQATPPFNAHSWPDVNGATSLTPRVDNFDHDPGTVYQHRGDADMDLSLNYFVKTVGVSNSLPSSYGFSSQQSFLNFGTFYDDPNLSWQGSSSNPYQQFQEWGRGV